MGVFFSSMDDKYVVNKTLDTNFSDGDISQAADPLLLHLNPLFQTGNIRPIEAEDVGKLEGEMASESSTKRVEASWEQQMNIPNKEKRSLMKALFKADGLVSNLRATGLYIMFLIARYALPEIINRLLSHVSGEEVVDDTTLWILVSSILVVPLSAALLKGHCDVLLRKQKARFETGLIGTVFNHAIVLSPVARAENGGSVEVLFQTDIPGVAAFSALFVPLIFAPLELAVGFYLAYRVIGVAVFWTLLLLVGLLPVAAVLGITLGYVFGKKRDNTKQRVLMMKELVNGIRIVKYYAWESSFQETLEAIRAVDMYWIVRIYVAFIALTAAIESYFAAIPVLAFYVYITQGNPITYATQFTALAIFALMSQPVRLLSGSVQALTQLFVSINRVRCFLEEERYEAYVNTTQEGQQMTDGTVDDLAVFVGGEGDGHMGASFGWTTTEAKARAKEKDAEQKKKLAEVNKVKKDSGDEKMDKNSEDQTSTGEIEMLITGAEQGLDGDGDYEEKAIKNEDGVSLTEADREILTLKNINVSIPKGTLAAVVGPVGCGKSSLVSALLNDMLKLSGHVSVCGSIAYHAQNPWILNATIKENIIFGAEKPYDDALFQRVIEMSALGPDLATLAGGLQTEIGEKGINLSGGQKARISFARALYAEADLLLLDDPLSAVDANVCDVMFNKAIKGQVEQNKNKTVVLVTHQIHLLSKCDMVIVMNKDGSIKACCKYEDLAAHGVDLSALEEMVKSPEEGGEEQEEDEQADDGDAVTVLKSTSHDSNDGMRTRSSSTAAADVAAMTWEEGSAADEGGTPRTRSLSGHGRGGRSPSRTRSQGRKTLSASESAKAREAKLEEDGKLLEEEDRVRGIVGSSVWTYFAKKGGAHWFVYQIFLLAASKVVKAFSEFWLSEWGSASLQAEEDKDELSVREQTSYLNIYAAFSFGAVVLASLQFALTAIHAYNASGYFFNSMLERMLRAPIGFFDVTPSGRIINRFTGDINTADMGTSAMMGLLLNFFIEILVACGTIAYVTSGTLLIILVPMGYVYYVVQLYFRKTNTEVKRLLSISRSPVYTEIGQSLQGITSLRAYKQVHNFQTRLANRVDTSSGLEFVMNKSSTWLDIRLNLMGAIISFFVVALAVASPGFVDPAYMAVALNASLFIPILLQAVVNQLAMIETMLASVERLRHFSEGLPIEDPTLEEQIDNVEKRKLDEEERDDANGIKLSPGHVAVVAAQQYKDIEKIKANYVRAEPPADWPQQGKIEFENVKMSYRDGPLVLQGVSVTVQPRQKVGICGRTGSGKSSMLVALFRVEQLKQGRILVDGIDISTVPVQTLRSRLAIIPQDPVMFSASLRYNVDPFDRHSDAEIWTALEQVNLKEDITAMPGGLDSPVAEGGSNLSVGQRQLICFTRALLRKPKIVVLDEATAAVDNETDNLIQQMIKKVFKDCTVLTIAHRLNTIIDSDALVVLDQGILGEFDTPVALKDKQGGIFAEMWTNFEQAHAT